MAIKLTELCSEQGTLRIQWGTQRGYSGGGCMAATSAGTMSELVLYITVVV